MNNLGQNTNNFGASTSKDYPPPPVDPALDRMVKEISTQIDRMDHVINMITDVLDHAFGNTGEASNDVCGPQAMGKVGTVNALLDDVSSKITVLESLASQLGRLA